jgi:tripartite-type tricarboxylate transporter receptor subunit TctC
MYTWRVVTIFASMLLAIGVEVAFGQAYPVKVVRVITVGYGSNTDVATRLIGQGLPDTFGQRLVVENRGIVGIEIAAKSAPDGYTLLHYTNPLWLLPLFRSDANWDALRDFVPITQTLTSPNLLAVHPSLPVNSVRQLIALAKAKPGQLNYGSSSTGSGNHVSAEMFNVMAGIKIVRVNYKGAGQAVNDLIAGQIDVMFPAAGSALPYVNSGRLKGLAITSAKPSPLVPGIPTLAQAGLPTYESSSIAAIFAPVGTPATVVERVNESFVKALKGPELSGRLLKNGIEAVGSSSSELTATIKAEIARMEKVIRDAGLRE